MKAIIKAIGKEGSGYLLGLYFPRIPRVEKLAEKGLINVEIEELKSRRSLTQNAYAWLLISKIAEALGTSKEEIYFQMLKDYGQRTAVSVKEEDAERFEKTQKYFERLDSESEERVSYMIYAGSSLYNSVEMAKFIDGIINEAEALGIYTLTPQEIAKLKLN